MSLGAAGVLVSEEEGKKKGKRIKRRGKTRELVNHTLSVTG